MDGLVFVVVGFQFGYPKLHLAARHDKLVVNLAPLSDAQIREKLPIAQFPKLVLTQGLPLFFHVLPQIEPGNEIGLRIAESCMLLIGLCPLLLRSLARVLYGKRTDNHQRLIQAVTTGRIQKNTAQLWIHR